MDKTLKKTTYGKNDLFDHTFKLVNKNGEFVDEIRTHKVMLAVKSPMFHAKFTKWSNPEADDFTETIVEVDSKDTFKFFLKYFYTDQIKEIITAQILPEFLHFGSFFTVDDCINDCQKYLISTLNTTNVVEYFFYADKYELSELKKYCEAILKIHFKEVIDRSNNLFDCPPHILSKILKFDHLCSKEIKILDVCAKWITESVGVSPLAALLVDAEKKQIDFNQLIRFKSMESNSELNEYRWLFTPEEDKEIKKVLKRPKHNLKIFTNELRKELRVNRDNINLKKIDCDRRIGLFGSYKPYFIQPIESTIFSISKPLLLTGFECCKVQEYAEDNVDGTDIILPTEISIFETAESKEFTLYKTNATLGGKRTFIRLRIPIVVRPDVLYTIEQKQSPSDNYGTRAQLMFQMQIRPEIMIQFRRQTHERAMDRGLIARIEFIALNDLPLIIQPKIIKPSQPGQRNSRAM